MNEFRVGAMLGDCKNCGCKVQIRQPWLSMQPIVNDGWYLVHCTNSECHNYYGMEIRPYEIEYVDFLNYKVPNDDFCNYNNVIKFEDYVKGVRNDRYNNS